MARGILGLIASLALAIQFTNGAQSDSNAFTEILSSLSSQLSTSCDTVGIVTQVLIREIEQRVKLQENVETRLAKLEEKVAKNEKVPLIAFSARVEPHIRGLTKQQKVAFSDVVTNLGNAYDPVTSEFRCPVSGLYHFEVTILSEPGERIETELMAAGVSAMKIYSGAVTYFGSGGNSVLLQLNKDDRVFVRLHLSTGSNIHRMWSTFGGHLVQQI
ncbi:complement C1q-like protein 4 [Liolophura sinensis]|uniref:complement C1q-like protein 4 n=1 Tax=Liolophura sinensis TaxID=3198878 RepID=UPI0031592081